MTSLLIYARLQLTGLNSIIPEDLLSVFDENELEVSIADTTEQEKIGLQRNEGRELVSNPISLLKQGISLTESDLPCS